MRTHFAATLCCLLAVVSCGETAETGRPDPPQAASGDDGPSHDELERLRALGYVHVAEDAGAISIDLGARDLERAAPGFTYYTTVNDCSSHLIDLHGNVLREWSHEPCHVWGNSILLPDGDVLAVHRSPADEETPDEMAEARYLLRLDWNNELRWKVQIPVHHDVDIMPNGNIAALTYRHRAIPEISSELVARDHYLMELTPDGEIVSETSLGDILLASSDRVPLQDVKPRHFEGQQEVDHLHSNSIEFFRRPELAKRDPLYAQTNMIVCFRHQDMVVIFDWKAKRAIWSWGQGEMLGPHDATLLANGNILIFDNGLGRKWSRVVEVDPHTDEIVWEYRAPVKEDFYTITRGASQRTDAGTTLITNSRLGAVFEVTPDGEVVWSFETPKLESGKPRSRIVRARRLPEANPDIGRPFSISD